MVQTDDKNNSTGEWIPIYQKRLGEAINYAKGSQSMAEFARKCRLNPMTLSRAVNGDIKKPLDEEMIRVMAECSDAPTEDVYEFLMRANGWVKKDSEIDQQSFEQRCRITKDRSKDAQNIIMRTLFEYGYTLASVLNTKLKELDPTLKESRFHLNTEIKFALKARGYEPSFCNFTVNTFTGEEFASNNDLYSKKLKDEQFMLIERYKGVFLRDAWEPDAFENTLYSIVFLNRDLFEAFWKLLNGLKFNSSFSLILIDLDGQEVVEERFLPRRDGRKSISLLSYANEYGKVEQTIE